MLNFSTYLLVNALNNSSIWLSSEQLLVHPDSKIGIHGIG